jgi:hypothetical protein
VEWKLKDSKWLTRWFVFGASGTFRLRTSARKRARDQRRLTGRLYRVRVVKYGGHPMTPVLAPLITITEDVKEFAHLWTKPKNFEEIYSAASVIARLDLEVDAQRQRSAQQVDLVNALAEQKHAVALAHAQKTGVIQSAMEQLGPCTLAGNGHWCFAHLRDAPCPVETLRAALVNAEPTP